MFKHNIQPIRDMLYVLSNVIIPINFIVELMHYSSVQESLCILILKCLSSLAPPTMTQCRELEASHHEQVSAMANQLLEKFSRNQLEEDECPDQLRMVSGYNRMDCDRCCQGTLPFLVTCGQRLFFELTYSFTRCTFLSH